MYLELVLFFVMLCLSKYYCSSRRNTKKNHLPPGPHGIPIFGYLPYMGKVPCLTVTNLSDKYGKMMTLQLGKYPVVFVNDFDTLKELFKMDVLTGRAQLEIFNPRGYYGLGLLDGKDWEEVRRFVMRSLRELGVGRKSMEASILEEVSQCTRFLEKNTGKPLYLKPLIELVVVNALWEIFTGEKYNMEDPLKREVASIMSHGLAAQNLVGIGAFLPWVAKLFPNLSGYSTGMKYFGAPATLARQLMAEHMSTYDLKNHRDFIDVALSKVYSTIDPQSQFYKERGLKNLQYTILDLFFAGSDTLSSTLGWAFLYLAMWPEVQGKVQSEIDQVLEAREPCAEDQKRMPYVKATMSEVMRKSTLTPFGLFHAATHDFEFDSFSFPKGTWFLGNMYRIHNDRGHWGDPESFRPERFLDSVGIFRSDDHLIPFLTGKRICPAKELAMLEYFLFFVGILQKFSFLLDPTQPWPDIRPRAGFILTPPKHDLFVTIRK